MNTQKIIISQILIAAFLFYPKAAYNINEEWLFSPKDSSFFILHSSLNHFLSIFSHANIFHLAGNIICLWLMKCKFRLPQAVAISFVCSFLPQWSLWGSTDLACGFSGVLFAVAGMAWGDVGRFRDMVKKCILPLLVFGLFPNVNIFIHLYCLLLGYAYSYFSVRSESLAALISKPR